jgi:hypothetical protein
MWNWYFAYETLCTIKCKRSQETIGGIATPPAICLPNASDKNISLTPRRQPDGDLPKLSDSDICKLICSVETDSNVEKTMVSIK